MGYKCFLAAGTSGVFAADMSLPYAPTAPEKVITPGTDRGENGAIKVVTAFDSYLLAPDSAGGLRLFDIADPASRWNLIMNHICAAIPSK